MNFGMGKYFRSYKDALFADHPYVTVLHPSFIENEASSCELEYFDSQKNCLIYRTPNLEYILFSHVEDLILMKSSNILSLNEYMESSSR